jgi:hypothetical protein
VTYAVFFASICEEEKSQSEAKMKVRTGLLGAVVLLGLLFLVPAARADSDKRVLFTTDGGPNVPVVTAPFSWTMAADQGVVAPNVCLGGCLGETVYEVPEAARVNLGGGQALYNVQFDVSGGCCSGAPGLLLMNFGGFLVTPTIPFPDQPGGPCEDQASWDECMDALYSFTAFDYPGNPFSINKKGDFIFNPGVYQGEDDCCGSGFTISKVATPEPSTGFLLGVCLLCSLLIAARKAHG